MTLHMGKLRLCCSRGYTLIEVMLVFLLIVLIVSVAAIFFANSLPKAGLRATGREMAATIKYAKYLAQATNDKQLLDIDFDSRTYAIKGRETKKIPPDVAVSVIDTNLNVVRSGRLSITFDALGGNGWRSIVLEGGPRKITVAMDPIMIAVVTEGKR